MIKYYNIYDCRDDSYLIMFRRVKFPLFGAKL